MDIQEAIEHCKEVSRKNRKNNVRNTIVIPNHWISSAHCAEEHEQIAEWLEELKQYKQLGTPEEVKAAVEKQKAKKVKRREVMRDFYGSPYAIKGDCPVCGAFGILSTQTDYCHACVQKLDWS